MLYFIGKLTLVLLWSLIYILYLKLNFHITWFISIFGKPIIFILSFTALNISKQKYSQNVKHHIFWRSFFSVSYLFFKYRK